MTDEGTTPPRPTKFEVYVQTPDGRVPWPEGEPYPGVPVLPYPSRRGPTSGYAEGVATSEERARHADTSGQTQHRQGWVLGALTNAETTGLTWAEIDRWKHWGHGSISGVLSNLHKAGKIARLTERRDGCFVYVLPEHVNGRETQEQGRPRQPQEALALAAIQAEHKINRVREVLPDCEFTLPGMDCPGLAVGICLPCRIRRILDGHDV